MFTEKIERCSHLYDRRTNNSCNPGELKNSFLSYDYRIFLINFNSKLFNFQVRLNLTYTRGASLNAFGHV